MHNRLDCAHGHTLVCHPGGPLRLGNPTQLLSLTSNGAKGRGKTICTTLIKWANLCVCRLSKMKKTRTKKTWRGASSWLTLWAWASPCKPLPSCIPSMPTGLESAPCCWFPAMSCTTGWMNSSAGCLGAGRRERTSSRLARSKDSAPQLPGVLWQVLFLHVILAACGSSMYAMLAKHSMTEERSIQIQHLPCTQGSRVQALDL